MRAVLESALESETELAWERALASETGSESERESALETVTGLEPATESALDLEKESVLGLKTPLGSRKRLPCLWCRIR